jgi:methylglyoxal synthase
MAEVADTVAPQRKVGARKRLALIAHDNRKADMLAWARFNRGTLGDHDLFATGTTGGLIAEELDLPVHRFLSGPLGGDQQVGAAIAEGRIDAVIFFWDPLSPHPHDVDVKALLRVAVVHNVPIACNRATADFILSSPLMAEEYAPSFTPEATTSGAAGSRPPRTAK